MKNGGIFLNLQTRLIFKEGKQEREANKYTKRQNVPTDIDSDESGISMQSMRLIFSSAQDFIML